MNDDELKHRFTHHPPKPEQIGIYREIRARALEFARYINGTVPDSREKAQALTDIEDAVMHANAGVARHT